MTEKTKILTVRIPKEVKEWCEGYDTRKLIQNIYELSKCGVIDITNNEISVYTEEDEDGVWVRDMAHDLNLDKEVFKKKVEQGMR